MTTQELEVIFWQLFPFFMTGAATAIVVSLLMRRSKAVQCPTPDASIMKALEKRLSHLVSTAQTKDYFLKEAEKLWDARELLTPKK